MVRNQTRLKNKYVQGVCYFLIAVFVPAVMSCLFLLLEGQTVFRVMPAWDDEDFYFNQLKSILAYGQPLGYYGYDGSHAPLGHFGAHGWFLLMPYALFARIFGLHYCSVALCNHVMLAAVLVVYEMLFRPAPKQALAFSVCVCSPMLLFYVNTFMMEGGNYVIAILSAVWMAYLAREDMPLKRRSKLFLGVFLVLAVLYRVTWSILLFPYLLLLLKDEKRLREWVKWLVAAAGTLVGTALGYGFYRLFAAEYFQASYATAQYGGSLLDLCRGFVNNVLTTFLFSYRQPWVNLSRYYILFLFLASFVYGIVSFRNKKLALIPLVVLSGCMGGVVLFYSAGFNALRTVYAAAVFAAAYLMLSVKPGWRQRAFYTGLFLFLLGTFWVQGHYGFEPRSWYAPQDAERYQQAADFMSHIRVKPDAASPWENTLGIFLNACPDRTLEMQAPAGIGINYYSRLPQDLKSLQACYLLLPEEKKEEAGQLAAAGYVPIDRYEGVLLLELRTK